MLQPIVKAEKLCCKSGTHYLLQQIDWTVHPRRALADFWLERVWEDDLIKHCGRF